MLLITSGGVASVSKKFTLVTYNFPPSEFGINFQAGVISIILYIEYIGTRTTFEHPLLTFIG